MHRVARNKHQITRLDSPNLFAHSKSAPAFDYEHQLVVLWLDVNDIRSVFQNIDVAGDVLAIA